MKLNKLMLATMRTLTKAEPSVKKNYKAARKFSDSHYSKLNLYLKKANYKFLDREITVDGHSVPVRMFYPKKQLSPELILFFHGGGWVTGTIDSYSEICEYMSDVFGRRILSVDYRRAPENPFPAAIDDCYGVTKEIYDTAATFGITGDDIILMGDSAGGNLAAVVSLKARDTGDMEIRRQILLYPLTYNDHTEASPFPSVHENGTDYLLTSQQVQEYMELYVPNEADRQDPYVAPLLEKDLSFSPKTLVITAEFDPLRDEGEEYARRLLDSGNYVELFRIADTVHGFMNPAMPDNDCQIACGIMLSFISRTENKRLKSTK